MRIAIMLAVAVAFASGAVVQTVAHANAERDLAHEVATQCAADVSGFYDSLSEGTNANVPSPLWDELVVQCAAEFDNGADYGTAIATVIRAQ